MKKKIVKALFILFGLFVVGAIVSVVALRKINNDLRTLIGLHKVEIIRQDLVINVQNVQGNLFTVGTGLGRELDEIVLNVTSLDNAVNKCSGCHHNEVLTLRIQEIQALVGQYKELLSVFLTTVANESRLTRTKIAAAKVGDDILEKTQEMTFIANKSLQRRTESAIEAVVMIQDFLIGLLVLSMLLGVGVAISLTKKITNPIRRLVAAAREISSGKLGYTTDFNDATEFGTLARTFNEMSLSLKESHEKIVNYMNRLSIMARGTVSLYSSASIGGLLEETLDSIREIVAAERIHILALESGGAAHEITGGDDGGGPVIVDRPRLEEWFSHYNRKAVIKNDAWEDPLPFRIAGSRQSLRNVMIVWFRRMDSFRGAIIMVNKGRGPFEVEDIKLLSIVANNFTVALDNILLYEDLRRKMGELKETQQQLVQAAKLAAIGELASNVAHEINNPLTSILGYAELIKEEDDHEMIMKDITVIEQESLRAREIVRQLLEFSRKKPLELRETEINELVQNVLKLVLINLKGKNIRLIESYSPLPPVMGDENQLKQVFLNVINNAVSAMELGGDLSIETLYQDGEVCVFVSDTGMGIDEEDLPRVFEPFFTTKKEKGTGLGLSISYKIISAHNGRIDVYSKKDEGTRFTVVLPVKTAVSHVSP